MELEDIISLLGQKRAELLKKCGLTEELYQQLLQQNIPENLQKHLENNLKNPIFAKNWYELNFLKEMYKLFVDNYLPF